MSQRGFTLIELLVATAIAVIVGFFCLRAATAAMHALTMTQSRFNDAQAVARLSDLWRIDEDQAWAIFTPPSDVNGAPNTDGHEIDFFMRDAKQRPQFWSYTYNAAAKTVTRYMYSAPGATPVIDETFTGITSFLAHTYPVTALQDSTSPIYSPLYSGATLQAGAVQFYAAMQPWIAGGNQITYVRLATAQILREVHLSTATAPSGWIVVLNYTPAPTPTAASGLTVWPPAIMFAQQGTTILADTNAQPLNVAALLNGVLGGGIARAAAGCTAVAYTDSTFTTALAPGTSDPNDSNYAVDAAGCWNGGQYVVSEPGYTGTFNDGGNSTCGTALTAGGWNPTSQTGPTAAQTFTAGSTFTSGSCSVPFVDGAGKAASATAQVIEPCEQIGGSCTYSISYLDTGGASCDPSTGEVSSGYTGSGFSTISPTTAGSWTGSGGTYTFVRSALGAVTVTEDSQYKSGHATLKSSGGYQCTYLISYTASGSFTIPSL